MEILPEWMKRVDDEDDHKADIPPLLTNVHSRRSVIGAGLGLISGVGVLGSLALPRNSFATQVQPYSPQILNRPAIPKWPEINEVRQVWLKRKGTSEEVVSRYYDGRQVVQENYIACCSVLRDFQSGSVVHMDLELLDLVFSMQKWLVEWGIDKPLLVHSGYRSPATNAKEGGARNSMHMKGKALDFSIEGIPPHYMGRLASILAAGGVGTYIGNSGFIHIDTGGVRYWSKKV